MISKIKEEEYNPYYGAYIAKATYPNIAEGLAHDKGEFINIVESIPEDKFGYAYASEKWTIAEVLQHIIDTERIFTYRALRFSRNDKTSLPGFEQDDYALHADTNHRSKEDFISDFKAVRNSSVALYKSFTEEMLTRVGEASGSPMSVRAAGYMLSGHQKHHLGVIQERYL